MEDYFLSVCIYRSGLTTEFDICCTIVFCTVKQEWGLCFIQIFKIKLYVEYYSFFLLLLCWQTVFVSLTLNLFLLLHPWQNTHLFIHTITVFCVTVTVKCVKLRADTHKWNTAYGKEVNVYSVLSHAENAGRAQRTSQQKEPQELDNVSMFWWR